MTSHATRPIAERFVSLSTVDAIASVLSRYGLVVVIGWIGALKFANFEARQIQPLVAHSPFMG
jgi:reactive chlorine resistance protein C